METFKIQTEVSKKEVESLLINMFETSMGWAETEASEKEFLQILEGKEVEIKDMEEEKTYTLTLDKLLKGIGLFVKYNRYYPMPLDELGTADDVQSDMILQYALFNELIYG